MYPNAVVAFPASTRSNMLLAFAAAALVDRSNGLVDLGVPFFPLIRIDVPVYEPQALPPELAAIPAEKPGSRKPAPSGAEGPVPSEAEGAA